jgi:sodium/bile acid cotransporter 7
MRAFLARHWFLLLILAGAVAVWQAPEALRWTALLDPALAGAAAVLLSAWGLEGRRLWAALARPRAALGALAVSYGLLPALAWLLGRLLPEGDFRLGLLLMASVPCTLASAVIWTRLAAGNEATALLITLCTNASSWLFTTAWLTRAAGTGPVEADAAGMMLKLLLVLVLPVALGQLLRTAGPLARVAERHRPLLGVAARVLTLTIMLRAALEVRDRLGERAAVVSGWTLLLVAVLCLAAHLGALAGGYWGSRVLGCGPADQVAVALGGSQKTLPVALILFDAYFTGYPLAVVPVLFFHVGQLVADTFLAERWARRQPGHAGRLSGLEEAAGAVV